MPAVDQAVGGDVGKDGTELVTVPFADRVDEALRGDADVDGVTFLSEKSRRSEPGNVLGPVNVLLQPIEDLLPDIHRWNRPIFMKIHSFSTPVEIAGLWKTGGDTSTAFRGEARFFEE